MWALICLGLLNRGARLKAMVPTMSLFFFLAREISLLRLEKFRILYLLVVRNGGPLMLVFANARVISGFSIFGNTFNAAFLGFPTSSKPL